jgi:hypothetical protein
VRFPWRATIDVSHPEPARLYAALAGQAIRFGMPARGRAGALWSLAGRPVPPERLLVASARALPAHPSPALDAVATQVVSGWEKLAARSLDREPLPPAPPRLGVLALERRAARTVFLVGDSPAPLLVLKLPAPGEQRPDRELEALAEAEPARVAPLPLGRLGDARVQEGLAGAPVAVEPLGPGHAAELQWPAALADLCAGLVRLAQATAKERRPDETSEPIERALSHGGLSERARGVLASAWRDVESVERSVLRHRDASPQNCLYANGRLAGIVDWENARSAGAPGFDAWNAALAYLEYAVALDRWSQGRALAAFQATWPDSAFWREARTSARAAAAAAGVPETVMDQLELCFFGRRLGVRLAGSEYAAGPARAAAQLERVCISS